MPPATRLPAASRPVSPAVKSTREGLTLTPGMKPRPFSTGRSARISRRSMGLPLTSTERPAVPGDELGERLGRLGAADDVGRVVALVRPLLLEIASHVAQQQRL